MNHLTLPYWLLGWALAASASAQGTDTLRLAEIRISESADRSRLVQTVPATLAHSTASVSALLDRSAGSVRSYGPGILQTVSFRGFAASQTLVLWEGFPLNHGMVGLADLSLYPAYLTDALLIDRAGGSSDYGLSAIGGTVELAPMAGGHEITLSSGAYGERMAGLRYRLPIPGRDVRVGSTVSRSDNDFTYRDVFSAPVRERRRGNAERRQAALMLSSSVSRATYVERQSLLMTVNRAGIPGPISAGTSRANQEDAIIRHHARFGWKTGAGWTTLSTLLARHDLDYRDPDVNTVSLSEVTTLGGRIGYAWTTSQLFVEHMRSDVRFTEYDAPSRRSWAVQADTRFGPSNVSGRLDHDSAFGWFWSAGGGFRWTEVRFHIARTVGIPTFNDLYWPVLGNPALTPESAWKAEASWSGSAFGLDVRLPVYAASITDGIQWLPGPDGRVRPRNIRQTRSVGFEPEIRQGAGRLYAAFTDARYSGSRFDGDRSVNRQVAYVPRWTAGGEATLVWSSWFLNPDVRFTGRRFTTEDGQFPLPAHWVADLTAGLKRPTRFGQLRTAVTVRNLTDTAYSTIRWYPMPGRHVTFILNLSSQ